MKHPFVENSTAHEGPQRPALFHSSLSEYLIVLSPHEALWNEIMNIKKMFAQAYDCPFAYSTKPHVTLVNFIQYRPVEDKLRLLLRKLIGALFPVKIELKDYGSFPTHTIYINITSKVPIVNLVKELKPAQQLMKTDKENKPFFITEPHLTIARRLEPWQYEKAWLAYQHMNFTGRFIANSILMLRRPVGEKKYTLVEKFEMQSNTPPQISQGVLF
jgi:2'-5' RNA ligase